MRARPARAEREELFSLTAHDDQRAFLRVNMLLPMDVAKKVLDLISGVGAPPEILESPERT